MKKITLHFSAERTVQRAMALASIRRAAGLTDKLTFSADERSAMELLAQEALADLAVELAFWLVSLNSDLSTLTLQMPDSVNSLAVLRLMEQTLAQRLCGMDAPSLPVKRLLRGLPPRPS